MFINKVKQPDALFGQLRSWRHALTTINESVQEVELLLSEKKRQFMLNKQTSMDLSPDLNFLMDFHVPAPLRLLSMEK